MARTTGKDYRGKWLQIDVSAPAELVDALSDFISELGAQGVYQESLEPLAEGDFPEPTTREVIKAHLPDDVRVEARIKKLKKYIKSLAEIFPDLPPVTYKTEIIEDPDWGEAWKKYFKPLRVSKNIVIKPTWERYTPHGHDIVIEIDPGMAFGTGQHPSTRMCLEAIEDLMLKDRMGRKWRVLDVGTGTGILGIACAQLSASRVVSVDNDAKATEIARENVLINHVEDIVEILTADVITIRETFNLIVANLTAKVLLKLKDHLSSLLDPGGFLIMSGIIDQNRGDIEDHFFAGPFTSRRVISEKEWLCYVLQKNGEKS
jgi:ribosomal protein L11 methyltransferase